MNSFTAFVKKEFFHILRDRRTLLIAFALPIIQLFLFGFALRMEIQNAAIGVLDHAKNHETMKLWSKFEAGEFFELTFFDSEKEIEDAFQKGTVKAVIQTKNKTNTIDQNEYGFQILLDASDPNFATNIKSYIESILIDFKGTGTTFFDLEFKMMYNQEMKSVYMFVPGLMSMILMLLCAFMTSISITREKEVGTMEILLVSPLTPYEIIFGKVIPYAILAFINAIFILVISFFVFHVPIVGSLSLLLLATGLFIVTALSLGILFSSITDSQQVAMLISLVGLMLPTVLLSDFIFPLANMPLPLQMLSNLIPAKWFVILIRGIMLKGLPFSDLIFPFMILIGMAVILLTVSIKKFKLRLT
jgi:ABC-2 type transport system permease protein